MLAPQSQGKQIAEPNNQRQQQRPVEVGVSWESPETIQECKYTVIIPAYNEERRIGQTILDLESNFVGLSEILVIFDGNDHTPEIVSKLSKKARILRYDSRLGHGGAVFEGIKNATGDIVCLIDADGSSPWYEVQRICSIVSERIPAVFGSRWVEGSKIGRKEKLRNIIGGRVYHYLSFSILGVREKDSFCGLKAFKKELALELAKRVTLTDRTFNIAISYNLKLMGIKPLEVGVEWSHREGTQLHVGLKAVTVMFLTLIGLRIAHSTIVPSFKVIALRFRRIIRFF